MLVSIETPMVVVNRDTGKTYHQPMCGGIPLELKESDKLTYIRIDGTTPEEVMYKAFLNYAAVISGVLVGNEWEQWHKSINETRKKIKSLLNLSFE